MKRMIMGAMVLSLAVGSLALADPPGYDQDHHDQHHHMDEHHGPMVHHQAWGRGRYVRPHGYYRHTWRRGDRLPPAYRASAYVIPNAAVYHLRPAPRGYYWIRVDGNAVLASMATGAVLDVHVNLFP
jgi:Ni/Co efflux regulator RcnB